MVLVLVLVLMRMLKNKNGYSALPSFLPSFLPGPKSPYLPKAFQEPFKDL